MVADSLELRTHFNDETKASKSQTICQVARDLVSDANIATERAGNREEVPPEWVQAIMSLADWDSYGELRGESLVENHQLEQITPRRLVIFILLVM